MNKHINRLSLFTVDHPKLLMGFVLIFVVVLTLLAALPSFWPHTFSALPSLKVDTDPENMLHKDEPLRIFHNQMKKEFSLYDIVVVGIINEKDPDGVFNPKTLNNIYELTQFAKTLHWTDPDDPQQRQGVIGVDLIAPSTVDNITQSGFGAVRFEWLMAHPPKTREEARKMREQALKIPFLNGTLVSEDGKAICLYIPISSKDISYEVSSKLKKKIATFSGDEQYHITGLPVAEDTFGFEMFIQMAISAPAAMLVIFFLLFLFFRKLILVVSPLIVALLSVLFTMSLLVITGNTIHIMSSMIPIFIMPIAVLDSIHILSEFYDNYQKTRDRRQTIVNVVKTLFSPMLYTTLTSIAGFASLALTPIPPVQVFGIFVAVGIFFSWILTLIVIPAYVMLIPQKRLENFGAQVIQDETPSSLSKFLHTFGRFSIRRVKWIFTGVGLLVVVAIYGITQIEVNDNPMYWFQSSHPIRVADKVLNKHFGGTYMAYLELEPEEVDQNVEEYAVIFLSRLEQENRQKGETVSGYENVLSNLKEEFTTVVLEAESVEKLLSRLEEFVFEKSWEAQKDHESAWKMAESFLAEERGRREVFKNPEVLRYLDLLQQHLNKTGNVGKVNSISDIVKTVHRELFLGKEENFRIPDTRNAVAQCLITFQNSHRPNDLWHFITPDYRKTSLWVQLKTGDNQDMSKVVKSVRDFMVQNPPPFNLKHQWFGLTYINVIWQEKMVSGMLQAFLGSFLVVFLMMTLLFRSPLWGIFCMVPLTITIGLIYGVIGLMGKHYDMPIAILSSLTLGLAVDFAIHFLARARSLYFEEKSWRSALEKVFGEPARAIYRNIIVIAGGFLPLLLASLVPYNTVGIFLACILLLSGFATLMLLPGLIEVFQRFLFPATAPLQFLCRCGYCLVSFVVIIAIGVLNLHQFFKAGWTPLTFYSIVAVMIVGLFCFFISRRAKCYPDLERS